MAFHLHFTFQGLIGKLGAFPGLGIVHFVEIKYLILLIFFDDFYIKGSKGEA